MITRLLRWVGHHVPNIRYLRAIPNQILMRLHNSIGLKGGLVDVLGFKMRLDPRECVDAQLWFAPHLYDKTEIDFLFQRFPQAGLFLDVGANIGFWSLRFSQVFPSASIYAIEANPSTFQVLQENVHVNNFTNIKALNVGVSEDVGELPLYCNDTGNRGGDSFVVGAGHRKRTVIVTVKPLYAIIAGSDVKTIDLLKMDIEGFEEKVISRFFVEAPGNLWPRLICVETSHVPSVMELLESVGYRLVLKARENRIYELNRV